MGMKTYLVKRGLLLIPTFLLATSLIFVLVHLTPGDPVELMFAGMPYSPPTEVIENLRKRLGLDRPLYEQYFLWLGRLLQGDFGYSYLHSRSIMGMIMERFWKTVELVVLSLVLAMGVSIVLGSIAAVKHLSLFDSISSVLALFSWSMPQFWLALVVMLVFSIGLRWFPTSGYRSLGAEIYSPSEALIDHVRHLILPLSVLASSRVAYLYRIMRASMLEVLRKSYIRAARAKGLKERTVLFKHALRNALLPMITVLGTDIRAVVGGAIVIETIFAWPGLGMLMYTSAVNRDYPAILGASTFVVIFALLANLLVDIIYAKIDPRIKY